MPVLASGFFYAALTALLLRDLLPGFTTHLFSDVGDPLIDSTIMAWNAQQLPLTAAWWNFPAFVPLKGVTAFTEHFLLVYPLTTPVIWLTGNPILAYNLVFFLLWPVNALAAYALAYELTGSRGAAFIGGLAFGFAPYMAVQTSHPQILLLFGMPLSLLGLHRYLRTRRWTDAATFAAGWLAAALSSAYTLVFFPMLLLLWAMWFVRPKEWRVLVTPIAAAAVASLPLIPLLAGYSARQAAFGFTRSYGEARAWGADVAALLGISHREWLWSAWLPTTYGEAAIFPGFTIVVLAIVAMVMNSRAVKARAASGHEPDQIYAASGAALYGPRTMLAIAGIIIAIVLARIWTGPDGWPLPPFRPYRVFTFAVLLAIAALLASESFRASWRRRDVVIFYVVGVVFFWLLALGPEPTFRQERILTYGIYRLFFELNIPAVVRVSARAWIVSMTCLAVLASFGTAVLLSRRRRPVPALALIAAFVIAEAWFNDRAVQVPPTMPDGIIPAGATVLEVPFDDPFVNAAAQYRGVIGHYRTINGYSGYDPPQFLALQDAFRQHRYAAVDDYRRTNDLYVIVRRQADPLLDAWLASQRADEVSTQAGGTVYRLAAAR